MNTPLRAQTVLGGPARKGEVRPIGMPDLLVSPSARFSVVNRLPLTREAILAEESSSEAGCWPLALIRQLTAVEEVTVNRVAAAIAPVTGERFVTE